MSIPPYPTLPFYNVVRDFGAKGDGSTDDRAAITNAFSWLASAGGGELYFPAGTYRVTRDSNFAWALDLGCSNVVLRGQPGRSFIQLATGQPNFAIATLHIDNQSNVMIRDMGIDGHWGNAKTEISSASHGFKLPQSTIHVETTSGFPASGSFTVLTSAGSRVVNYTGLTSTTFTGCSGGNGETLTQGGFVGYVNAKTGINHTTQTDPKSHGIMIRGCTNVHVDNCQIRQCYGDGIWLGHSGVVGGQDHDFNIRVTDTTIDMSARSGIAIGGSTDVVYVGNCRFTNIFAQAFDTEPVGSLGYARDVTIERTFLDTWWDPTLGSINSPLSIQGGSAEVPNESNRARKYRVRDCTIMGSVLITDAVDVIVERNRILLPYSTMGSYAPVYVEMDCDDIWILDNFIYDAATNTGGNHPASITVQAYSSGTINAQPAGVTVRGNRIHARNGRAGIQVAGTGQFAYSSGAEMACESGTSTAIDTGHLFDSTKSWIPDQWIGKVVRTGGAQGTIINNLATVLIIDGGGWRTLLGLPDDPSILPSTGSYTIYGTPAMVTIENNTIDCFDDGNGAGGAGIVISASRAGMRVRAHRNEIISAATDAIKVVSVDTNRRFLHLEITENMVSDVNPTPVTSNIISFQQTNNALPNPIVDKFIMRGNVAGRLTSGSLAMTAGLTKGVWLVSDGDVPIWAGYGSPEGAITASRGAIYSRVDGSTATTLYVKESGTATNTGWQPHGGPTTLLNPSWIDQLLLVGGNYDPVSMQGNAQTCTSGIVLLEKVRCYSGTITSVILNATQAQTGASHVYVGIYKSDGTQASDMVTATVDAATALSSLGSTGIRTINLTNAVSVSPGQDVYVAILVTGSPSADLKLRASTALSAVNGNLTAAQGLRSGSSGSGQTSLPGSITLSGMAAVNSCVWVALQ